MLINMLPLFLVVGLLVGAMSPLFRPARREKRDIRELVATVSALRKCEEELKEKIKDRPITKCDLKLCLAEKLPQEKRRVEELSKEELLQEAKELSSKE